MKMTRKVITLVLALVMILSLTATAFAATSDITFAGGAAGAEYSAYKLLKVTHAGENYYYEVNTKYQSVLEAQTGKTTSDDIVKYIEGLDTDGIRTFADQIYAKITAVPLAADYVTDTDKITDAEQGYYLIAETKKGDSTADTWSLVMIDTVGDSDITITTKESFPTIEKEVYNVNDSTGEAHWGEHADYDIGDTIPYRLSAKVSGQYDNYKNYWYEIVDTMSAGLTYNGDIKIMIGSVDVTDQFAVVNTGNGFTATADLKQLTGVTVAHNSVIEVSYTCTLNANAVSGAAGNKNTVVLKYQNDPYAEGTPSNPGVTPEDVNIVFTYDTIVNKVDQSGNALAGAGFTLYKWNKSTNDWAQVKEITGETTFRFEGLDKGIYKLVETTVPDGYKKAADIEFHVHPEYDTTKDPVELKKLDVVDKNGDALTNFVVSMEPGEFSTNIVNVSGKELPETGGMGTTLFYIFGSVMVLGAVVLLVTKKRMAA